FRRARRRGRRRQLRHDHQRARPARRAARDQVHLLTANTDKRRGHLISRSDRSTPFLRAVVLICALGVLGYASSVSAQPSQQAKGAADPAVDSPGGAGSQPPFVFDMGEIVVVGSQEGQPVVGGSVLSSEQIWMFDRKSLDQAVNVVPGVIS